MPLTEVCCCCSLITKLCPILWDPMDCSPPDSSVHEISQQEYWSALIFLLQGILSTQGSNLLSLHWQADSLVLSHLVYQLSSVQSLSHARLFVTPWTVAQQASLSITDSWSLLKLMFIQSVMPSNHLILCRPLLPLLFASGGQSIGASASASVLPINTQDWFPLGYRSIQIHNTNTDRHKGRN